MKKIFLFILIASFLVPSVLACINSLDSFASEVFINKPGLDYSLDSLKNAENLLRQDNSITYQSQYSPNLAVVLSEGEKVCDPSFCSSSLSIRLQFPAEIVQETVSYLLFYSASAPGKLNITNESTYSGWEIRCDNYNSPKQCEFVKDFMKIFVNPVQNTNKSELMIELYDAKSLSCSSCSGKCITSRSGKFCITQDNLDEMEGLLKNFGLISNFNQIFLNYNVFQNTQKSVEDLHPINEAALDSIDWTKAMDIELRWLRKNNVLRITEEDIKDISRLSAPGKSGKNSLIFYSKEDKKWEYYYDSSFPVLTNLKNCQEFPLSLIPKSKISYPPFGISAYYLIPIAITIFVIMLFLILIVVGRMSSKNKPIRELDL